MTFQVLQIGIVPVKFEHTSSIRTLYIKCTYPKVTPGRVR
jgi:hypothetical protein